MRPQLWHVIVLLVVVLLVFGAAKLPDIARNVGKSAKILKEEVKDLRGDEPSKPAAPYTPPPAATTQPHVDPYAPGGTAPPGVSSPTDAPSTAPNASPSEWPPGSSSSR